MTRRQVLRGNGIPHENHTLEYIGKILIDNYPVAYYNITKGST